VAKIAAKNIPELAADRQRGGVGVMKGGWHGRGKGAGGRHAAKW